jgi:hypothetical protein
LDLKHTAGYPGLKSFILLQEDSWDCPEVQERLKKEKTRGEHDVHDW